MSVATKETLCDKQAIIETLKKILGEGQVTELRIIEATTSVDSWPKTYSGYFNNPNKLAETVSSIWAAKGVYFVPNAINPDLLARRSNWIQKAVKGDATTDTDITRRRWLLIDCDAQRPTGISSNDSEHEAAIDRCRKIYSHLRGRGWPDPIAADSGNGGHLLYRIDLPIQDDGLVQRCLSALANIFDDDAVKIDQTVFNPARIWKLYGTRACKGDSTEDRPHRMAKILNVPKDIKIASSDLLIELAGETVDSNLPNDTDSRSYHGNGETFDIHEFIDQHGLDVEGPFDWNGKQGRGRKWTFNTSPLCEHHGDGPYLIQHASGAISAGCHHDHCSWTWRDLRAKYEPPAGSNLVLKIPKPDSTPKAVKVEPYRPFPVEVLPEPLRSFVKAGSDSIGCDPSYIALPALAACGAAVDNTRRIQTKRGWTEPPILWAAIVGESGTQKTPAFRLVMQSIERQQDKAFDEYKQAHEIYEQELVIHDKQLQEWKRDKGTFNPPPGKPERPVAVRYVVSDTTIEALAPILLDNPRGVLLARDELAGWLGSFDRYSGRGLGADAAAWLSIHNAEPITTDRKTGPARTIYVPSTFVCIAGGIQPRVLHKALGEANRENGLAARLLLACPPQRPKRWTEADISPVVEGQFTALLDRLYSLKSGIDEAGKPSPVVLKLFGDAKPRWIDWYNRHAKELAGLSGDLRAAYSKLEACCVRLALIDHCIRSDAGEFSLVSIEAGVTLTEWFKQETRRVYQLLAEGDTQRELRRLAEWIEGRGGAVTVRELAHGLREFRRDSEAAEAALNELYRAGYGKWETQPPGQQGGRPTCVFRLSPPDTVTTTPKIPENNEVLVTVTHGDILENDIPEPWGVLL